MNTTVRLSILLAALQHTVVAATSLTKITPAPPEGKRNRTASFSDWVYVLIEDWVDRTFSRHLRNVGLEPTTYCDPYLPPYQGGQHSNQDATPRRIPE
jgi:hypothetical protein